MTKNNNRRLTGILLGLLAVLTIIKLLSPNPDTNIAKEFAALDTASIYQVNFHQAGENKKAIQLKRNTDAWKIMDENREGWAKDDAIHEMLRSLYSVRIDRLVGSGTNSWNELYVNDTLGIHVTVSDQNELMADWYIGSPSKGRTHYIRSNNEAKVYILQNEQLPALISKSFEEWLDKRLIKLDIHKINKIVFNYPADSSVTIMKLDSSWTLAYKEIKPSLIDNYLNNIIDFKLSSTANDSSVTNSPDVTIKFFDTNDQVSTIESWKGEEKWIVSSSYQHPNYFFIAESTMQNEILLVSKGLKNLLHK